MRWRCRCGAFLKETLKRGHVEVTLQVERRASAQIQLNAELLEAYVGAFREGGRAVWTGESAGFERDAADSGRDERRDDCWC